MEKPVGTIWIGLARRGEEIETMLVPIRKNLPRDVNIKQTTTWLLGALWRKITFHVGETGDYESLQSKNKRTF